MPFASPGIVTVVDRVLVVHIALAAWPRFEIFPGGRGAILPRVIIPRVRRVPVRAPFPREIRHGYTTGVIWRDALQVTPHSEMLGVPPSPNRYE